MGKFTVIYSVRAFDDHSLCGDASAGETVEKKTVAEADTAEEAKWNVEEGSDRIVISVEPCE